MANNKDPTHKNNRAKKEPGRIPASKSEATYVRERTVDSC